MPNWGFVWMVAWPDFRTRLPRFLVIGLGMSLVMAVTLLLAAFAEGFRLRADRVLDGFGADRYVVAAGSSGPLTATSPLPRVLVDAIDEGTGLDARPLFLVPTSIITNGTPQGVVVVGSDGTEPGFGLTEGRRPNQPGDAVTDEEVDLAVGDEFLLAGKTFTVVGRTKYATWNVATAGIFIERTEALELFAAGRDVVTAVAVDGEGPLTGLPDGLVVQSRADAFDDLLSRTASAKVSIDAFTVTLWVLAVVIVGALLTLAALERVRDFAIFKATGAGNADLVFGLGLQAALVGTVAGLFAIVLAYAMKPFYPGVLSLPIGLALLVLPVAVGIAVLSSVVGVRRAIRIDPSQAFG